MGNTGDTKRASAEREYVTAVSIMSGIITLIEPTGDIGYYRQRDIEKLTPEKRGALMRIGALSKDWAKYKALPRNYSISFEDPEIQGKALASFTDRYADACIRLYKSKNRGKK